MKIVVFGGSGFLGSHVADELTRQGHEVTIYDKRVSPYIFDSQLMIQGDIMDRDKVFETVKGADYVYNFSGIADIDEADTKPLETVQLNIIGNLNIMDAVLAEPAVKKYIYASTIYVYSQKGGFYRCSKQAAEIYIEEYQRKYGLQYTILRYGTLYGKRADYKNSIYSYLKRALEKGRIVYQGSNRAMREYINVSDAARLSVQAISEEFNDRNLIITGNAPMRFEDLMQMIGEILGKQIEIEYTVKPNDSHYDFTPYSFTPRAGHKLVSNCYVDLGQGLLECIEEIVDEK